MYLLLTYKIYNCQIPNVKTYRFMNMHVKAPPHKEPEVKHLDVNEALVYFKKMFPGLDGDVIESVLRANHGCVDESVNQLLVISQDSEKEKLRTNHHHN
ncbi:hypothetical protein M8J76_001044 [Diaphorina citri]|nr:hypothetical protein M8J75_001227 [Diaphorina citri]KAI5718847.1 hypothetical protein M8J76_001044 [Diaphorina citri]KAI5721182.1 hypothetical protein M8J77_017302 [Diaphorina citri]